MNSYDKIYHLLLNTSTCKDIWNAALKDLDQLKIEQVTWNCHQSVDIFKAVAMFHLTKGILWPEDGINEITPESFFPRDLIKKILELHFGPTKDVKTFNCNLSIVYDGGTVNRKDKYGYRCKEYQPDFGFFLRNHFLGEVSSKIREATERLQAQKSEMMATEEFAKARHEALIGFCKDNITRALLPWQNMDHQVLKDAWDQFICTTIMGS